MQDILGVGQLYKQQSVVRESIRDSRSRKNSVWGPAAPHRCIYCTGPRFIMAAIAFSLLLMGLTQSLALALWPDCEDGVPCKYKKTQREIFERVIHQRIPLLRKHAERHANFSAFGISARAYQQTSPPLRDCVKPWMDFLKEQVGGNLTSRPEMVRDIVQYMRLMETPFGREVVGKLLSEPVHFGEQLDRVATCAKENTPLHATLCSWLDDPSLAPTLATPPSGGPAAALSLAVHEGLVLERLAAESTRNREFRVHMASHYARISDEVEAGIVSSSQRRGDPADVIKFRL